MAALVFTIWKIRALPWDVSDGIAGGLARFSKMSDKDADYPAAYQQLTECIYKAWESKDPGHLLPLVANPIAQRAWQNLAPAITKMTGGKLFGSAEKQEEAQYA